MEVLFEFWDGNLAEVEDAGGKGCVAVAFDKGITEMLLASGTSAGDDGDGEIVGELAQSLVGIAVLRSVVVHRGEEYLTGTTLLGLVGPFKQTSFRTFAPTLEVAMPAVGVETGINGADTNLRTETTCNLVDEFGTTDGGAVDADLVGTGKEQPLHVGKFVDAAAYGKGDVDFLGHSCYHIGKRLAALETCGDIEETQFVGTLLGIGLAQFYGVTGTAQVDEVRTFDGLTVLYVEAGDDSLG